MRGFWHILEAIIAGMLVLLFLMFLVRQPVPEPRDLTVRAFELLHALDKQDGLREFAENEDFVGIQNAVRYAAANLSVQVCNYDGACAGGQPNATQRWSGTYLVAGRSSYRPKEIRLFLTP